MGIINLLSQISARVSIAVCSVWHFYVEGFRSMTVGRVLWTIILIKLFVIFAVLKLFFFPDILSKRATDGDKASYVAGQLVENAENEDSNQKSINQ